MTENIEKNTTYITKPKIIQEQIIKLNEITNKVFTT